MQLLHLRRGNCGDLLSGRETAGEGYHGDIRVLDQCGASLGPVSGYDIDDPRR